MGRVFKESNARRRALHKEKRDKDPNGHQVNLSAQRAYMAKWREKNREKSLAYFRNYNSKYKEQRKAKYRANFEKIQAKAKIIRSTPEAKKRRKEYDEANREKLRKQWLDWAKKNPERMRAIELRHRIKRAPKKRESDRVYRQLNPEIYKNSIARAKSAKPELYKQIQVKIAGVRRARRTGAAVEPVSLQAIEKRDLGRCHLCKMTVLRKDRSFDHLIPVARLGPYAEWNLMIAHLYCNKKRRTKMILSEESKDAALAYIEEHRKKVT